MGIVHRDFKPENIFITSDEEGREQVKVMDFGVAKLVGQLDGEIEAPATALPRRPLSRFTKTGSMLGTPYYMAPEQIVNSANLGPTADVWALGVVAYECLTGCVPFDANDLADLFANIHARKYAPARSLNPDVPATFEEWFNVACAAEAASRFSSASGAADALSEALGRPNDAPRSGSNPSLPSSGEARRDFRSTPGRTTPAAAATPPSSGRRMTPLDSIDARAETLPTDTPSVRDDASSRLPEKPWTSSVARTPAPRARGKSLAVGVAATAVLSVVGIGVWRSRAHVDPPAPSQSPPESVSALNLSPSSEIASAATTNTPNAAIASASHAPSVPAAPVVESPGVKPSRARRPAPTAKAEPAAANEAPSAPPPPSAPPATAKPSGAPAFTLPPVGF
jgi:serine/threonine-protein kinase